jgi:hypothetical protein
VPNALIECRAVFTNNPPCGAMRGFGAVQTCFAAEAQMDKLAVALEMDPGRARDQERNRAGRHAADRASGSKARCRWKRFFAGCAAIQEPGPEELPRDPIRLPGRCRATQPRGDGVRAASVSRSATRTSATRRGFDDYCAARVASMPMPAAI